MSERIKKAKRRYTIELFCAMALYIVIVLAAKIAARQIEDGAIVTALALAPILPLALAAFAFFRFYFRTDERDRRISADAAALTLVIGVFSAITLGFLRAFGVFSMEDEMIWFGPYLIVLWGAIRFFLGGRDC